MAFTAIPPVPQGGEINDWEFRFFTALKQDVEILTGQRLGTDGTAVLASSIGAQQMPSMLFQQVTASPNGVTISGSDVPLLAEYVKLMVDVQTLGADVATLRVLVNDLIAQLKGDA